MCSYFGPDMAVVMEAEKREDGSNQENYITRELHNDHHSLDVPALIATQRGM